MKVKKSGIFVFVVLSGLILGCTQSTPVTTQAEPPASLPVPVPPPAAEPAPAPAPQPVVVPVDEGVVIEPNPGPGPYTGTAMGYHGIVEVILDVKDKVIISASAIGDEETVGIGTLAIDNMPGMMVEANSIDIDTISGATSSSLAVLEAAAKALGKAGLTDTDLNR
jgi:uncharacterized protein with FMN-binding domain